MTKEMKEIFQNKKNFVNFINVLRLKYEKWTEAKLAIEGWKRWMKLNKSERSKFGAIDNRKSKFNGNRKQQCKKPNFRKIENDINKAKHKVDTIIKHIKVEGEENLKKKMKVKDAKPTRKRRKSTI